MESLLKYYQMPYNKTEITEETTWFDTKRNDRLVRFIESPEGNRMIAFGEDGEEIELDGTQVFNLLEQHKKRERIATEIEGMLSVLGATQYQLRSTEPYKRNLGYDGVGFWGFEFKIGKRGMRITAKNTTETFRLLERVYLEDQLDEYGNPEATMVQLLETEDLGRIQEALVEVMFE